MGTLTIAALIVSLVAAAPPPPSPAVIVLEKEYSALLNLTCARVVTSAPTFPSADQANFMQEYARYNGSGSEDAVIVLAKQLLSDPGVQSFLTLADSFTPAGGLDADMVLCAVLFDATPLGLAEFAVNGPVQKNLISSLLNDTYLMRDMLLAGGPIESQYGPAMTIYSAINAASTQLAQCQPSLSPWDDRTQSTILCRLALGTALALAVPVSIYNMPSNVTVDPVARYLHYETAYLAGDLDPAFEVLSAFECSLTSDSNAQDEDHIWLRTTMANYRPDYIAREYTWRYTQAVHQEVPYGDPICSQFMDGVCNGHYSQIPVAGGVCGPRAFFSRFARKSFGMPTWGMTESGHAAMSSWSPIGGWSIQLGSNWPFGWWGPQSGDDFILEVQSRENRSNFQSVLRGGWVAKARGESPVSIDWVPSNPKSYGQGGVWGALMLYAKKIFVNATLPLPPRVIGPSVVPTKVAALLAAWPIQWPKPNITTDVNGTINIPGAAFNYVNRSADMSYMKSYDLLSEQLVIVAGNYLDLEATTFTYEITVPEPSTRYLTANFSTWHMNTDLLLRVNNISDDNLLTVPIYYTFGYWNQSQSVEVDLVAGKNALSFMRSTGSPIAVKEFFIYLTKPDIPAPPANYTPTPPAPRPDRFIEVPADTTCAKQGITDVPATFCADACESLAFKYDGGKPEVNMTGCFVMTSGKEIGMCIFNTNATASVCPQQPCTIGDSIVQQLCIRQ